MLAHKSKDLFPYKINLKYIKRKLIYEAIYDLNQVIKVVDKIIIINLTLISTV